MKISRHQEEGIRLLFINSETFTLCEVIYKLVIRHQTSLGVGFLIPISKVQIL